MMRHLVGSLLALATLGGLAGSASAATVSIACGAVGQELQLCQEGAAAWAKKTGNEVKVVTTPNSATDRLALYQQILAAGSGDIDVYQIDVIWPGLLANQMLDLKGKMPDGALAQHFPALVKNNTVDGKLVAIPWYTDAGLLYYRSDLLEKYGKQPPKTWAELAAAAKEITDKERAGGNPRMEGFVFQGKAYEGLTADALEWVNSFGGGTIVDESGKITVNNPQAAEALTWAASTVGTIAPAGVLNYEEEEARGVFQSGNAVFMRNWPYAWSAGQGENSAVKGKIGVVPLPTGGEGGKHAATLGGWQLAVSRYSKNPDAATDLAIYLTGADEQKRRAVAGSYNPTIEALYKDADVLKANPFYGELYDTFTSAVARPSTPTGAKYNQVSAEFFGAVHSVLAKQAEAKAALAGLERRLDRLSRGGRW